MLIISSSEQRKNSFQELFDFDDQAVDELIIASAYFDIKSINEVISFSLKIKNKERRPRLKIFVDSAASRFYSDEKIRKELYLLSQKLHQEADQQSGIFLVNLNKLFHTKLYFLGGIKQVKLFFGSINLTQYGLNRNEEILVDVSSHAHHYDYSYLIDYTNYLQENSIEVSQAFGCQRTHRTLRNIILDGYIYYEVKKNDPFRFKLCLPPEFLAQGTDIDPLLDGTVVDSISLKKLLSLPTPLGLGLTFDSERLEDHANDRRRINSHWKRFCIETCYGFWSPTFYQEQIKQELKIKEVKNDPYYKKLTEIISNEEKAIEERFLKLCERVTEKLNIFRLSNKQFKNIYWRYENKDIVTRFWRGWILNLNKKLQNPDFYSSLVLGVSKVKVPDIWADPLISSDFEESFLNAISYGLFSYTANHRGNSNALISHIYHRLQPYGDVSNEKIKEFIERDGFAQDELFSLSK